MELRLDRYDLTGKRTIGRLYIDGKWFCYTLEDTVRPPGQLVLGETAIPAGRYELAWWDSPRFKRRLPILKDVPGRSYILIHAGNTDVDTAGCILVGMDRAKDSLLASRFALETLLHRLEFPAWLAVGLGAPSTAATP